MFFTPTGEDALEILSRRQMRSYGWCYTVDGVAPEVYPSDFLIEETTGVIEWFFGYAFYDSGEWLSQCEPLHLSPYPFICSK
jgi:hypothetical protein